MEEPGRDSSKYDTIMPTIVRPCTRDTFVEEVSKYDTIMPTIVRPCTRNTFVEEVSNYPSCQLLYDPVPGTPL